MLDKTQAEHMKDYMKHDKSPVSLLLVLRRVTEILNTLHMMGMKHGHLDINKIYLKYDGKVSSRLSIVRENYTLT